METVYVSTMVINSASERGKVIKIFFETQNEMEAITIDRLTASKLIRQLRQVLDGS